MRAPTLLLASLLLTACGSTVDGADTKLAHELRERNFISQRVEGRELVAGTRISVHFGDRLSTESGCNQYSGPFRIEGGRLRVSPMMHTEEGCEPAHHAQDVWFEEFLGSSPQITLTGNKLTLTGDGVRLDLLGGSAGS